MRPTEIRGRADNYRSILRQVWDRLWPRLSQALTDQEVIDAFLDSTSPYAQEFVPAQANLIFRVLGERRFPKRPKPTDVPYASFGNPQSLNLYSYVNNNPTTTRDPDGHVAGVDDAAEALVFTAAVFTTAVVIYESPPQNQRNFAEATSKAFTNTVDTVKSWFHSESKDGAKTGEKTVPNPNGSKGAPDHQATTDEEAAKMGGEREVRVQTPGGEKGSRVIDAARTDANGKVVEATQVIRPNKDGTPPAREVRAASDIQKATGVQPKLVPVRPIKPDGQ